MKKDNENAAALSEESATVLDRLKYLREMLRLNQSEFGRRIGVDASFISRIMSGKLPISQGFINRVAINLGVSRDWLGSGKDVPFPKGIHAAELPSGQSPHMSRLLTGAGAPVYDIDVTAGCRELSREFTNDRVIGRVSLPQLDPEYPVVRVSGDSMAPKISNGGFISIRPISDSAPIFWGQIYVVLLEDYRMVKYVRKHPTDPVLVLLHSENPQYDDIEVSRRDIKALYLVETIINYDILT